jgi:streptogramin lyase/two-component sensor histidine kinase
MTQVSKNEFFIGTDKGINVFNDITNSFDVLNQNDALSSSNIRAMIKDSRENVWIGTMDRGIMKYDLQDKSFQYFGDKKDGKFSELYDNTIWAILEGYRNDIWIGTLNGLFRLDPDSMSLKKYHHIPGDENSLSHDVVYSLYEDQHHDIWAGTYGGLNKYDRSENRFEVFRHRLGDPASISTNKVFGINQDAEGYLWIGTMGGGLNRMNPYTEEFRHFTEQDGLSNNVVYDIIIDRMGYMWLSTNKGLSRFDPENETFINYDINDGIQSYEFNLGAAFRNSEGKIFMGGMNGFNIFLPSNIRENQKKPELVVSQIRVLNRELPGTFFDGDTIMLNHDDNFLSLEFAAIDYTNPVKNQYKYRLKPLSKEWINTTSDQNIAEFTELSPGSYVFHLIGSNSDGVWNEQGLKLRIIVKPAWYQRGFVRYGSMTLLAALLFLGIYTRTRRIKKNHQVEKQVMELERKAMRLQMNPHFIFNTLNSIQNYILEHEKKSAISYLNKFSRMMRQVLYNSDKTYVPLSDEIELLKNYMELERLRFDKGFDYHLFIDENLEEDFVAIPPMLIQPHVENAILHGLVNKKDAHGKLSLSFYEHNDDSIKCIVEDNGIGREASQELQKKARKNHRSRGVSITKQRLEYINRITSTELSVDYEDKYDNNGNPEGTVVTLIIPVQDI